VRNVVVTILVIIAVAYAVLNYDARKDATFHYHTAECALNGCTFE
jgi:hypothetical protein